MPANVVIQEEEEISAVPFPDPPSTYILGDGGHGRMLAYYLHHPCLGKDDPVPEKGWLIIGVGDIAIRRWLYEKYTPRIVGYISPNSLYHGKVRPFGLQCLPYAFVGPSCELGSNVLVNTGAQLDHDCVIGAHSVISPGAILCGSVTLGPQCFIGAGATILPGVTLNADTFVPAGTLVAGPDDFRLPQRVVRSHRARPA